MKNTETPHKEMSFLDHLEVLRWHLVRSALAVVILGLLGFIFYDIIFDHILFAPKNAGFVTNKLLCELGKWSGFSSICINSKSFQIININMAGQFSMHIMVSLYAAFVVSFPYIIWELWRFISPALYEEEQKYARGAIVWVSILFFTGVLFGYYIILPFSISFLGSYSVSSQVLNQISLESYITAIISVVMAGGIAFEMPVLIYFLSKIGLVTPQFLRKYRKHAIIVILIIAGIITPPDVFSQVLVTIPLIFLYEGSIFLSKRVVKQRLAKVK